jgi:hypothetical protein
VAVGAGTLIQFAQFGPLAIVALPAAAVTGLGVAIHAQRLRDKARCLERIWDARIDTLARRILHEALQDGAPPAAGDPAMPVAPHPAGAPSPYRRLLAIDAQRLVIESCHPSNPWWPDPRSKRFCMEASVRARVYDLESARPVSDEVFAMVPDWRVGHEFEPIAWPVPPAYLYETRLPEPIRITRSYDEYCGPGGDALVQTDLRRMLGAMAARVLAQHGLQR